VIGKEEVVEIVNVNWNPSSWANKHVGCVFNVIREEYHDTRFSAIQDGTEWWYKVPHRGYVHPTMCKVLHMEPKRDIKIHRV
jgi:hypothetical protein